ncbi:MAG TPA: hypothetical protein VNT58_05705 [Gaiellaceae bacterium]|nr:hypothetical protein [Gaiellaceae bacterium]
MAARISLAVVVLGAVAVAVAWGWRALVVYCFFAGIAAAVSLAAGAGGELLTRGSRRRFDDRGRRR